VLRKTIVSSFLFIAAILFLLVYSSLGKPSNTSYQIPIPTVATPTPFDPFPYSSPEIPRSQSYRTLLVGDSMVAAFGLNAEPLRQALLSYYPDNEFVNYNYGFPSTNILSLPERLTTETVSLGHSYQSILSQGFDLIIIESFAYNPLSEMSLLGGLEKQNEVLEIVVLELIKKQPETVIAFMTPIAPNKTSFAKNVYDLSSAERLLWVEERVAYINNHIKFAKDNNIPLIDVYEKSLTDNGDGDVKYINPDDNIHPSNEGIDLMAKTIAQFIFEHQIFPK
jgi:hypothetical protein